MKIFLLEPQNTSLAITRKIAEIRTDILQLGHRVTEVKPDDLLYQKIENQKPDLVFNLASVYDSEKANRIPAILEIAGIPYTGSGMLSLSFSRFYNQLFPLVSASGVDTVPFITTKAEEARSMENFNFPLYSYHEGSCRKRIFRKKSELEIFLRTLPPHDEVILFNLIEGKRIYIYLLDGIPFLTQENQSCLEAAVSIYTLIEARGLARFDFINHDKMLFTSLDSAPDPLDIHLFHDMAINGWNKTRLIHYMINHGGNDLCHSEVIPSSFKGRLYHSESLAIRQLEWQESDLQQVLDIENASFNRFDAYTLDDFFRFFSKNPDLCIVVEKDKQIVGDLIARKMDDFIDLVSFAIHPDFRDKGIGTALFNMINNKCKSYGFNRIELEVRKSNTAGLSFWKKMGFKNTGVIERFYGDGEDALKMIKWIN